jgi:UDP-glucose 4-epimerase
LNLPLVKGIERQTFMRHIIGKNVMITGGAGFIGSHLVDRIICENPANIIVVDNFFLGNEENLASAKKVSGDLKVYRMDASDLAAMQEVIEEERVEVVFNLAVVPLPTSLKFPAWTVQTNVGIATTFSDLARRECFETLVHTSSSEVYGTALYIPMDENHPLNGMTPYAASKSAADHVILSYHRTFNIDATIVRPFNNFGPRQNYANYAGIIPIVIKRVKNEKPIEIYGNGEQTRDYIFAPETADAIVRVYENENTMGRVINLASGVEVSVNQLVGRLLNILGKPDYPVFHTEKRSGDVLRHCGDNQLAKELLGLSLTPMNDEQLSETVEWYLRSYA